MRVITVGLVLALASCQQPLRNAAGTERHDWFKLVMDLQAQADRLDRTDRRFVGWIANHLGASDDPTIEPTAKQRRWLLDIKRRLDARDESR